MAVVTTQTFRRHPPATAFKVTPRARAMFGRMATTAMDPAVITGVQADGYARRAPMPNGFRANGSGIIADTAYAVGTGDRLAAGHRRGSLLKRALKSFKRDTA